MSSSFRILFVEDDETWQFLLYEILLPPKYELCVVSTYKQAKEQTFESFDLLIIDLSLKKSKNDDMGLLLLKDLVDRKVMVPRIVLTGGTFVSFKSLVSEYDVVDLLTKSEPSNFNSEKFCNHVDNAIRSADAGKRQGGRPRNPDDDWAWEQVNIQERPIADVLTEWQQRNKAKERFLADEERSFRHAINSSRMNTPKKRKPE